MLNYKCRGFFQVCEVFSQAFRDAVTILYLVPCSALDMLLLIYERSTNSIYCLVQVASHAVQYNASGGFSSQRGW